MADQTQDPILDPTVDTEEINSSEAFQTELEDSTLTITKLQESLARSTADYQNLVKRGESERADMSRYFTENFARKLLPTLDNLDRVVSGTPPESQTGVVYEGVKNAAAGLSKVLEGMGVVAFSSVGSELDPDLHEALSQGPGPAGQIVQEFERGYKLGDRVIRHAKVIVGSDLPTT